MRCGEVKQSEVQGGEVKQSEVQGGEGCGGGKALADNPAIITGMAGRLDLKGTASHKI